MSSDYLQSDNRVGQIVKSQPPTLFLRKEEEKKTPKEEEESRKHVALHRCALRPPQQARNIMVVEPMEE